MKTLLIVEFPHKTKAVASLAKRVFKDTVFAWACLGHLRDLPEDTLGMGIEGGSTRNIQYLQLLKKLFHLSMVSH